MMIGTVGVSRRFGRQLAVDDVSFAVEAGEVVGLLGANGAGKSTLIRMILGLLAPSTGRVELLGGPPTKRSRARVGYVPQGLGLYPDLTVAENLAFVASAFSVAKPAIGDDLAEVAHRPVGTVSLGLRRRTAFQAAMSHDPDVLILDEPTSGVGPLGRAELWSTIGTAAETGAAVLVSTHYMEEAEQCDRIVMLAGGAVVARGSAAEIAAGVPAVEVSMSGWAAAFDVLDAAGLRPALAGDRLRVVGAPLVEVEAALAGAGIVAEVTETAARFEEAFVERAGRP